MTQFITYLSPISNSILLMVIATFAKSKRTAGATFVEKMSVKSAVQNYFHFAKIIVRMKMKKIVGSFAEFAKLKYIYSTSIRK